MTSHDEFTVVDSAPAILPVGYWYWRVRPIGSGWPEAAGTFSVPVEVIGDARGPHPTRKAILKRAATLSSCEDFAQSDRSSFVVGTESRDGGQSVIRAITLRDTSDLRFVGWVFDTTQMERGSKAEGD